jgi:hypothetical protein
LRRVGAKQARFFEQTVAAQYYGRKRRNSSFRELSAMALKPEPVRLGWVFSSKAVLTSLAGTALSKEKTHEIRT